MASSGKFLDLVKMQAAGNDFLIANDMRRSLSGIPRLARRVCHRQFGVGADGLILIQPARNGQTAYRMRIFNSDGSEAEMCGNGSRCAVKFAVESKVARSEHAFETLAGKISGRYLSPGVVRVALTAPSGFRRNIAVLADDGEKMIRGSFINTGVPHFVTFVSRAGSVDVDRLGRMIRFHRTFAPKGTNVNFVQILRAGKSGSSIRVRTYERGVESETLACGTGSTASAVVAALVKHLRPPVSVQTTGGAVLVIRFSIGDDGSVSDVTMQGPVEKVFHTRIPL